jgi:hypothetical protein
LNDGGLLTAVRLDVVENDLSAFAVAGFVSGLLLKMSCFHFVAGQRLYDLPRAPAPYLEENLCTHYCLLLWCGETEL